jgi:hypothetical protein
LLCFALLCIGVGAKEQRLHIRRMEKRGTPAAAVAEEEEPPAKLSLYSLHIGLRASLPPHTARLLLLLYSVSLSLLLLPPRLLLLLVSLNAETAQSRAACPRTVSLPPQSFKSSRALALRVVVARLLVASVSSAASVSLDSLSGARDPH